MKQLFLILVASTMPLFLGSCQEKLEWELKIDIGPESIQTKEEPTLAYEEVMALGGYLNPTPQGGDCWGDYFFQFVSNNSIVRIYNLFTKQLEQTLTVPSSQRGFVSNCHCNTVKFGTEYYDPEDFFPLIYVSTGYASGGYSGVLVYRIVQHRGVFFITLVQTIKFPVDQSSWTEFVPGNEYSYLCYTSERVIFKLEMPKLKDGNTIISRDSAIETYQFTPQPDWMATSRNQDRLFYKGKIAFVSGVPRAGEASVLVLLNLENQERELIIDFKKNGLMDEPESIFIWQGDLCIAFVDKIIRITNL